MCSTNLLCPNAFLVQCSWGKSTPQSPVLALNVIHLFIHLFIYLFIVPSIKQSFTIFSTTFIILNIICNRLARNRSKVTMLWCCNNEAFYIHVCSDRRACWENIETLQSMSSAQLRRRNGRGNVVMEYSSAYNTAVSKVLARLWKPHSYSWGLSVDMKYCCSWFWGGGGGGL